jgi:hypothetical protein
MPVALSARGMLVVGPMYVAIDSPIIMVVMD